MTQKTNRMILSEGIINRIRNLKLLVASASNYVECRDVILDSIEKSVKELGELE